MSTKVYATLTETRVVGWRSVQYGRAGYEYRVTATFELHSLSDQHPYFSATVAIYERCSGRGNKVWIEGSFGPDHETIARLFPRCAPFLKWHLTSTDGPMHYLANGLYWAGHSGWRDGKLNSPPNNDHLRSTIVYGALERDAKVRPDRASKRRLEQWLTLRLPLLRQAFMRDMASLFGSYAMLEELAIDGWVNSDLYDLDDLIAHTATAATEHAARAAILAARRERMAAADAARAARLAAAKATRQAKYGRKKTS